jgi:putative component of membrane protein insertase Oxa1/YidC/SpoIIIJ protein YidD/TM2 domain-containing membrane protein YozV
MASDRQPTSRSSKVSVWTRVLVLVFAVLSSGVVFAESTDAREGVSGDPPDRPEDALLGFYQQYLSSLRHARCSFQPSCSEYARQAIAHYGMLGGTSRAADRLMRCNSSARRFYGRAERGGLDDPVRGASQGRVVPRLEPWLLPTFEMKPPPLTEPGTTRPELKGSVDDAVSFARRLSVDGDCGRAETEYLRAAHLSRSNAWSLWAHFQMGACYFEAGSWTSAERAYLQAGMLSSDAAQRQLAVHLLAASLFNDGRYRDSEDVLQDPNLTSRSLALRGLSRMALGEWGAAAGDFSTAAAATDEVGLSPRLVGMEIAATQGNSLPHRSPGLATAMSVVLPGSGQMYAGRFHDGLRHLLFNGALIITLVKLLQNEHYAASYLVAGISIPFYLGNVRGSGDSARIFNRDRRLEHVARTIAEAGQIRP